MSAGFLRRLLSSLVDISIVVVIIYGAFALFGNSYLQGQVENYDEINQNLINVQETYDLNQDQIDDAYDEAKALAGDDEEAANEAYLNYRSQISVLNQHYAQDSSVYQRLLYDYNVGTIYFYTIGLALLLTILVIGFGGITPGRRLMKLQLDGQVSTFNIIIHDLLLKYVLVIALILFSPYFAFILIPAYLIIDIFMIMLSKDKTTLRDRLSKIYITYKGRNTVEIKDFKEEE